MFLELLLSLLALVVGRVLWWRWRYDLHKIPSPPAWPWLGHSLSLLGGRGEGEVSRFFGVSWRRLGQPKVFKARQLNFCCYSEKLEGSFVQLYGLGTTVLVVRDLECGKNILTAKTDPFPKSERITRTFLQVRPL